MAGGIRRESALQGGPGLSASRPNGVGQALEGGARGRLVAPDQSIVAGAQGLPLAVPLHVGAAFRRPRAAFGVRASAQAGQAVRRQAKCWDLRLGDGGPASTFQSDVGFAHEEDVNGQGEPAGGSDG